ncbi:MAG TPA: signal peptidase I [Thermoanaerobaculia bacterium]|nr:signal peptidase I [Thermoanaerobaculia bacterium]
MGERSTGEKILLAFAAVGVLLMIVWRSGLVVRTYHNSTGSMTPTLPIGAFLFVKSTQDVHRGEIVSFRYPLSPKTTFVKRIVAVGGDTVVIRDKRLYVNGAELREPYVAHMDETTYPQSEALPEPYRSRDQYGPFLVGHDYFFVLGDNRDQSSDSRYWGTVPRKNIIGRVVGGVSPGGRFWRPR